MLRVRGERQMNFDGGLLQMNRRLPFSTLMVSCLITAVAAAHLILLLAARRGTHLVLPWLSLAFAIGATVAGLVLLMSAAAPGRIRSALMWAVQMYAFGLVGAGLNTLPLLEQSVDAWVATTAALAIPSALCAWGMFWALARTADRGLTH